MRIAIFTDTMFPDQVNGVAKVAYRSAAMLTELGHEVEVISVRNVPTVPFWGYTGERFALPLGAGYRRAIRFQPDVIHVHTPFTLGWEAVAASWRLKVPLVGTHHTFFDHYLKHLHIDLHAIRAFSWRYLVSHYNTYDLVLSPSDALLKGMQLHGLKTETRLFPNSIHTELFVPASDEEKQKRKNELGIAGECLVYMGRLSYEKSIDTVIEAFAMVRNSFPDSTLLIIGDGPERKKLEKDVHMRGLEQSVIFTGVLHDGELVRALQAGDVFMTASKSENMPLSVMEAMATGLPVIGVNALGIPEIVKDGENGYVVAPDDVEALARETVRLFSNPMLRHSMASAAWTSALGYGERETAEALVDLYQSLL